MRLFPHAIFSSIGTCHWKIKFYNSRGLYAWRDPQATTAPSAINSLAFCMIGYFVLCPCLCICIQIMFYFHWLISSWNKFCQFMRPWIFSGLFRYSMIFKDYKPTDSRLQWLFEPQSLVEKRILKIISSLSTFWDNAKGKNFLNNFFLSQLSKSVLKVKKLNSNSISKDNKGRFKNSS